MFLTCSKKCERCHLLHKNQKKSFLLQLKCLDEKKDNFFPHPKSMDEKNPTNNWAPQENQNDEEEIKGS
jgi:hypothetical protein